MKVSFKNPIVRGLAIVLLPLGVALSSTAIGQPGYDSDHAQHSRHSDEDFSPLIDKVKRATAQFKDIKFARNHHWIQATPCVSGPDAGAMGVHFTLDANGDGMPDFLGTGVLNADAPQFLIYEPEPGGLFRLVGVEFLVLVSDWERQNPSGGPATLEGHLLNYVGSPNRYGLPPFYEMHVWAWEDNPNGDFADWNTRVTCEEQQLSD